MCHSPIELHQLSYEIKSTPLLIPAFKVLHNLAAIQLQHWLCSITWNHALRYEPFRTCEYLTLLSPSGKALLPHEFQMLSLSDNYFPCQEPVFVSLILIFITVSWFCEYILCLPIFGKFLSSKSHFAFFAIPFLLLFMLFSQWTH